MAEVGLKNISKRGVNYSFERCTGFGIFLKFSLILLDLLRFFGIFWDFFHESVRDFFESKLFNHVAITYETNQIFLKISGDPFK